MRKGLPAALNWSITGFSAPAFTGRTGLPCASLGTLGSICCQTALETVMALPFRSMLKAVMMSAFVPMPIVAPSGWPASMCEASSSPVITRSSTTFQLAWGSSVTYRPSSSK